MYLSAQCFLQWQVLQSSLHAVSYRSQTGPVVGGHGDGGSHQICRAVRLSWQPITPVQLRAMPSCSPVNKLEPAPRLALLAVWMGSEWEEAGQQERTFPRFRTAWKTNALHCLCHLSKVLPTCCIHLSRISEILGLSTKHHEIFAAVRRPQLGVTCEPRLSTSTLHPGQPSGSLTRFGSSPHPVGLIRVALPEHASWGNLKTPSNFAIRPAQAACEGRLIFCIFSGTRSWPDSACIFF